VKETYATSASLEWKRARRAAFVQDVLAAFTQRPTSLISFDRVSEKLKLDHVRYLDLQTIPLNQIVGSVGRYADFTRAFLPREDHLQERWQRIEQMLTSGRELPPVELYKVGQAYFVRDGNHRISVARQRGRTTIKAYVWEYETAIPLEPDSDVDELLCSTARAAFLERTRIDRLCPNVGIKLTEPGGYEDLWVEIEAYRQILSEVDKREIALDEGVTLWCELRYVPIVEIIRERFVLKEFPGRTETDLYLWLCANRTELEARYEQPVTMREAVEDLTRRSGQSFFSTRRMKKTAAQAAGAVTNRAAHWWESSRRALRHRRAKKPPQGRG
jgi:uncharacterized ParB-like nuclease family protein